MSTDLVKEAIEGAAIQLPNLFHDDGSKKPASAVLIELACDALLFSDRRGDAYAKLTIGDHAEIWPLRSQAFRQWLDSRYYRLSGRGAGRSMTDALDTLAAKARYEGQRREVACRVAGNDSRILIDLCNDAWQAVSVTRDGWDIVKPDVPFVRRSNMQALPMPEPGGSLEELRPFINANDNAAMLIVAWILASLRPQGPYPILILQGEQGSGKSLTERLVRSLIDPSAVPLRPMPRDDRDLLIGAVNNHVAAFDNLSGLQPWQSDTLCRLSTGGGFAARTLYTDTDETAINLQRPIILNGIDDLSTRPDLADRALIVTLEPLRDHLRTESEIMRDWERARPHIFSAILDALAKTLRELSTVRLVKPPRMADFAIWAVAALGNDFLACYRGNQAALIEESLEVSPLARTMRALVACTPTWTGSPTELLRRLGELTGDEVRHSLAWPKTERGLSNQLRRLAPHLRHAGIDVTQGKGGRAGRDYQIDSRAKVAEQAFQAFPTVSETPVAMRAETDGTHGTDKSLPLHTATPETRERVRI